MDDSLKHLQKQVLEFRDERNWEQFHNPKDLAISLSLEASEVLEIFQWKSPAVVESIIQNREYTSKISHEIADVLIYLLLLSDCLKIDLYEACNEKLAINREKYPVDKAYGKSTKYNEL